MPDIRTIAFDIDTLKACKGYDPAFISKKTPVDYKKILKTALKKRLPEVEGNAEGMLHYTDMSVAYCADRKLPFFTAYNLDGEQKIDGIKRTTFKKDPRISPDIQLSQKAFYDLRKDITEFEIGHMAANNEMAWGENAQLKAYQTFHFPNSCPQAERLNTGIWKTLETYIVDETASINGNKKVCSFTGPIITADDPKYKWDPAFRIPLLFFKVVVFQAGTQLYATAFVMSHEERMIAQGMFLEEVSAAKAVAAAPEPPLYFEDFPYKKVFQVSFTLLEELSGLRFNWTGVKKIRVPNQKNQVEKIRKIKDAKDAAAAETSLRKGIIPDSMVATPTLTESEVTNKNFKLNVILPH